MCSIMGNGAAKNRALPGVICTSLPSSIRRMLPAKTGTKLSAINPAGMIHSDLAEKVILKVSY
jgi:hypothetical protein